MMKNLGLGLGLEHQDLGLGLGLEHSSLGLDLGLAITVLGLGLGLESKGLVNNTDCFTMNKIFDACVLLSVIGLYFSDAEPSGSCYSYVRMWSHS